MIKCHSFTSYLFSGLSYAYLEDAYLEDHLQLWQNWNQLDCHCHMCWGIPCAGAEEDLSLLVPCVGQRSFLQLREVHFGFTFCACDCLQNELRMKCLKVPHFWFILGSFFIMKEWTSLIHSFSPTRMNQKWTRNEPHTIEGMTSVLKSGTCKIMDFSSVITS